MEEGKKGKAVLMATCNGSMADVSIHNYTLVILVLVKVNLPRNESNLMLVLSAPLMFIMPK